MQARYTVIECVELPQVHIGGDGLPIAGTTYSEFRLVWNRYYRLVFLEGTRSAIEPVETELSAFRVRVRTRRGVDLTRPPFDRWESRISSPSRYRESQALGRAMREAGVEAFRYRSARDPLEGSNVALFTSRAFATRRPDPPETWHTTAARAGVEFQRKDFFRRDVVTFERADFLVGGGLPQPAPCFTNAMSVLSQYSTGPPTETQGFGAQARSA